jgi:PBP1b-binding outer membrane lipoprotein LpoB
VPINPELVVTINGPIMTFIPKDNIDNIYWNVSENFTNKTNKNIKLKIGDFVLVQIINKRINTGALNDITNNQSI